jgi:hypothetical protein
MARMPAHDSEQVVIDWRVVYIGAALAGAFVFGLAGTLTLLAVYGKRAAPEVPVAEVPTVNKHLAVVPPAPRVVEETPLQQESVPAPPSPPTPKVKPVSARKPVSVQRTQAPDIEDQPVVKPSPEPVRPKESTEAELKDELLKVPEVALVVDTATADQLTRTARKGEKSLLHPLLAYAASRDDLRGFSFRQAAECQTDAETAEGVELYSGYLRALMRPTHHSKPTLAECVDALKDWGLSRVGRTRALVQITQPEDEAARLSLVRFLAEDKEVPASVALAQRAVFDLSAEVRKEAIKALKDRPPEQYREELMRALRHPWQVAADHAAQALVETCDRAVLPDLVSFLDLPDPATPFRNEKGQWVAPELVRINHLRNCLLCHAASTGRNDRMRGFIPTPGEPIPETYYGASKGSFVRADVVYLKQDFSVKHPVKDAKPWPEMQRYDYMVRNRVLSAEEAKAWRKKSGAFSYPQRESVLYALREITGEDAGDIAEHWSRIVLMELDSPHPETIPRAGLAPPSASASGPRHPR